MVIVRHKKNQFSTSNIFYNVFLLTFAFAEVVLGYLSNCHQDALEVPRPMVPR